MAHTVYSCSQPGQIFVFSNKQQNGGTLTLVTSWRSHWRWENILKTTAATFYHLLFFAFLKVFLTSKTCFWGIGFYFVNVFYTNRKLIKNWFCLISLYKRILLSIYFWSASAGHPSGQIGQNRAANPPNNELSLPTTVDQFYILRLWPYLILSILRMHPNGGMKDEINLYLSDAL